MKEAAADSGEAPCAEEPTQARACVQAGEIEYTAAARAERRRRAIEAAPHHRRRRQVSKVDVIESVAPGARRRRRRCGQAAGASSRPWRAASPWQAERTSSCAGSSSETRDRVAKLLCYRPRASGLGPRGSGGAAVVAALAFLALAGTVRAQDGAGEAQVGGQLTKAPKLLKFVAAVYPPGKHDAGVTASVLLSIEIGDDGKVGNVEVVGQRRRRLRRGGGGGGQAVRLRAGRDRRRAGAGQDHLSLRLHHQDREW